MENRERFHEINVLEKVVFKLSMITLCAIVGNICCVLIFIFQKEYFILSKLWIGINLIVIIGLIGVLISILKLNYEAVLSVGLFTFILFPLLWWIFPIKFPQPYIGLRKVVETGHIVADEYCNKDCKIISTLRSQGYYKERSFYSWKYAQLLGRNPSDDFCCYNQPFDNKYFFGILVLLELTFEYLPIIFTLTFLITLYEYYTRKDLDTFSKDFILTEEFDIRKINLIGVSLILLIVFYNIVYINSILR